MGSFPDQFLQLAPTGFRLGGQYHRDALGLVSFQGQKHLAELALVAHIIPPNTRGSDELPGLGQVEPTAHRLLDGLGGVQAAHLGKLLVQPGQVPHALSGSVKDALQVLHDLGSQARVKALLVQSHQSLGYLFHSRAQGMGGLGDALTDVHVPAHVGQSRHRLGLAVHLHKLLLHLAKQVHGQGGEHEGQGVG